MGLFVPRRRAFRGTMDSHTLGVLYFDFWDEWYRHVLIQVILNLQWVWSGVLLRTCVQLGRGCYFLLVHHLRYLAGGSECVPQIQVFLFSFLQSRLLTLDEQLSNRYGPDDYILASIDLYLVSAPERRGLLRTL